MGTETSCTRRITYDKGEGGGRGRKRGEEGGGAEGGGAEGGVEDEQERVSVYDLLTNTNHCIVYTLSILTYKFNKLTVPAWISGGGVGRE